MPTPLPRNATTLGGSAAHCHHLSLRIQQSFQWGLCRHAVASLHRDDLQLKRTTTTITGCERRTQTFQQVLSFALGWPGQHG